MRVLLRVQDFVFSDTDATWWQRPEILTAILEPIAKVELFQEFRYYGQRGKKRRRFASLNELLDASTSWVPGTYVLVSEDVDKPQAKLDLGIQVGALTLRLSMDRAYAERYSGLLDRMLNIVCDAHDRLGKQALMGPQVSIEILGPDYPKLRPPRSHRYLVLGALVTIICRNFHEQHRLGVPAEVQKLLDAPMPAGGQRILHGDLIIFKWAEDVVDEQHIQERRSLQDQWLSQVLELPQDPTYNAQGDYLLTPLGQQKDPILTFYDRSRREGYKAVVVFADGTVDDELFAQMHSWVQRRELPDGRPLERLNLILPAREAALQIRERATQLGAKGVYYIDNQGKLWDPFPPGQWI